jgi:uncharacterized protein
MKKIIHLVTIALLLPLSFFAQAKKENTPSLETQNTFAKSYDNVNDFEKILSPDQMATLNNTLKSFEKKTLYKIIIVTTSSIKPYADLFEYSQNLDKHLNTDLKMQPTILIVLSKEIRQIQVLGEDLIRYKITDAETKEIVSNFAVPEFKKGDYYKGLEVAVTEIIKKLQ